MCLGADICTSSFMFPSSFPCRPLPLKPTQDVPDPAGSGSFPFCFAPVPRSHFQPFPPHKPGSKVIHFCRLCPILS